MFKELLLTCSKNLSRFSCCHDYSNDKCNCYQCLHDEYRRRNGKLDEYNCPKKMNFYVLKYGSSFTSEIYHYLNESKILEKFNNKTINILSLGCGFSPDYYAILKYIDDNNLNIKLYYYGFDSSTEWDSTRLIKKYRNVVYETLDLVLKTFSFKNFDIIMMNKVFSTIYGHRQDQKFINNLINAINNTMPAGSVLIFNDINSCNMGRDAFDNNITALFNNNNVYKYYTDSPLHAEHSWKHIKDNDIVFETINDTKINPLREIKSSVFFEYWK
ncbi:MAG: hypothetical protein PHR82_08455 [Endomicrobiaceae bacterium]|nr:hypothetical protein [Endomicrobiaceae bacterium]